MEESPSDNVHYRRNAIRLSTTKRRFDTAALAMEAAHVAWDHGLNSRHYTITIEQTHIAIFVLIWEEMNVKYGRSTILQSYSRRSALLSNRECNPPTGQDE